MYSCDRSGSIWEWDPAEVTVQRVLYRGKGDDYVSQMAAWEGMLVCMHSEGDISLWSTSTGERLTRFKGDAHGLSAMCVCGPRLVTGGFDNAIAVWALGPGPSAVLERTQDAGRITTMAAWEGKVACGHNLDEDISVWEVRTGARVATLAGHEGDVMSLAVDGGLLISASRDNTVRIWSLSTWAAMACIDLSGDVLEQCIDKLMLAVSGTKLVCAMNSNIYLADVEGEDEEADLVFYELRVWDLKTFELNPEHTLRELQNFNCLATTGGEVWAGMESELVVWGRQ
jgi:WD40 repeat protein